MDQEMLRAAQEAAWAAQSAGEAAWWALLVNGLVVAVAVGATAFQDYRVTARLAASAKAYNGRAKVTLKRALDALDAAAPIFHAADDTAGPQNLNELLEEVERTIPLVVHYQSSDIGVDYLAALIKAEAALRSAETVLKEAEAERERGRYANGKHNGQIDWRADDLRKDVAKLR